MGERDDHSIGIQKETTTIETAAERPIRIVTAETGGSYFRLPLSRLAEIEALLKTNQIRYWVADGIVSFDGKPGIATIHLGHNKNPASVQTLIDNSRI